MLKSPARLSKLQPRYQFEYSDEKIYWNFLHHFRTLSETVWSVFRKFSSRVIKTAFYKSRGSIYWRILLVREIVSSIFFRLERHFFGILLKVFWRCGQNCKQHVQWNLLREDLFLDKLCFSKILPDIDRNLFGHSAKTLRQGYQNWRQCVHRINFKKKVLTFFHQFQTLGETFFSISPNFLANLSELHFPCPKEQFQGKTFWKILFFLFLLTLRPVLAYFRRFFGGLVVTAIYVYSEMISSFCNLDLSGNISEFCSIFSVVLSKLLSTSAYKHFEA